MALTPYEDILKSVKEDYTLEELENPDLPYQLADSEVPVYYSGILEEWTDLPTDSTDTWQGITVVTASTTIFDLMQIDLLNYYEDLYVQAIEETLEEEAN